MTTVTEPESRTIGTLTDTFGPLLRLDRRDRAGLLWIKTRSRMWLNGLKRRRRYGVPRGEPFTKEEAALIGLLSDLERDAGRLLDLMDNP